MERLLGFLPSIGTVVAVVAILLVARWLLDRIELKQSGHTFRNQILMILLTAIGVLVVILVIPMGDTRRGQVLSLIGIVLSAAIALSSTTILGNAMAGVMMRAVRNFRSGDFIRVGEHFGRVSERGLFHTEIQTEDRELTNLPNLYMVTHPVTTTRTSGTIVSACVSLGYDVPRPRIEELLLVAATKAKLDDAFVHVMELGDFSVTYRVAGMLTEVKRLLSARSSLRKCVMDALHEGGVEIVSPTFMNTRTLAADAQVIPQRLHQPKGVGREASPEDIVFDKAEEAESLENMQSRLKAMAEKIDVAEGLAKKASEGPERERAERELSRLRSDRQRLEALIASREPKSDLAAS